MIHSAREVIADALLSKASQDARTVDETSDAILSALHAAGYLIVRKEPLEALLKAVKEYHEPIAMLAAALSPTPKEE